MKIKNFYGLTNQGIRKENQDSFFIQKNKFGYIIFCIADGMGGQEGGKFASGLTTKLFKSLLEDVDFSKFDEKQIQNLLLNSVGKIQDFLIEQVKERGLPKNMGTTLNLNIIIEDNLFTLNIGDSRISFYDGKEIFQISEDHNLSTLAKNNPKFKKFEKFSNYLTSSLGPKKDSKVDIFITKLKKHGFLILTSDGVHNFVDNNFIVKTLKDNKINLEEKTKKIIEKTIENNSNDNMSCVLVEYEDI